MTNRKLGSAVPGASLPLLFLLFLVVVAVPFFVAYGQNAEKAAPAPAAASLEEYIQGKPFNVGSQWVVLADDYYLEDKIGVNRVMGHVLKSPNNPVVSADQPWEDSINWPHVIFDEKAGVYHMWYTVANWVAYHDRGRWPPPGPERAKVLAEAKQKHWYAYFIAYATSRDGRHWEKPFLDEYPYRHFAKTNIVFTGESEAEQTNIWLNDDQSDPARRFLLTYCDNLNDPNKTTSLMLAYSADGIHWQVDQKVSPLLTHGIPDGSYQTLYDKERNRWLLYRRPDYHSAAGVREGPYSWVAPQRRYTVSTNDRLGAGWTYPTLILVPNEEVSRRDIDAVYVFREGTSYLALVGEMDDGEAGLQEVHLAVSHDGVHWTWFPYLPPLIPRGEKGSWDAGQVQPPRNVVARDEFSYLYYAGVNVGQRVQTNYDSHIGMARLRSGRWIGLTAGTDGGYALSRELVVSGNRLEVNCQWLRAPYMKPIMGRGVGYIQVELLRRDKVTQKLHPIPGFTFAESDPLLGDNQALAVSWKGKSDLSSLRGTSVHVRFHIVQSELWEMRFAE